MNYVEKYNKRLVIFAHIISLIFIISFVGFLYYCGAQENALNSKSIYKIDRTIDNIRNKKQVTMQEIQDDLEKLNGQTEESFIQSSTIENMSIVTISEKNGMYKISYDLNGENESINVNFNNII